MDSRFHGNDNWSENDKMEILDSRFHGNDNWGGNDKMEILDSRFHGNDKIEGFSVILRNSKNNFGTELRIYLNSVKIS